MEGSHDQGRQVSPIRDAARRLVQRALAGGLAQRLEAERARWFVWLPVAFGIGIAGYFSMPTEPSLAATLALPLVAAALLLGALIVVRHRSNIARLLRGEEFGVRGPPAV